MSPPPEVVEVTEAYAATRQRLNEAAIAVLSRAVQTGRGGPEQWRDAIATVASDLLAIQVAVAELADDYLAAVLEAQGAAASTEAAINAAGFADMADGGGSLMRLLVFAPISVQEQALADGLGMQLAQSRMQLVAMSIVTTGMQDTGRSSIQASMFGHRADWYVRMLRGTSCARCAILAGRKYRSSQAFRRHKRCDCVHIPMAENREDWSTNPVTYFKSLSKSEQDRIFTKAGAQAIRDTGVREVAMNQIVNVRQGIQAVSAYGRDVQVTTVGTTKRALFGGYEIREDGTLRRRADSEYERRRGSRGTRSFRFAQAPRLLPDEIYRLAEEFGWDRAEVLRQLRRFAYVL